MRLPQLKGLRSVAIAALTAGVLTAWSSLAGAAPVQTTTPMTGEIEAISITSPGNVWSGGTLTVGGQQVILPANLLINLPNDYQSLQQLYANAPAACQATGETGLAKSDRCNARATGANVAILANRTDSGNVIAGQVDIFKALEVVSGTVTFLDTANGYFRVNGIAGDASTGVLVRVNDPTSRHTVQRGPGCAANNSVNCSPDVRFKIDPDNYTFCFVTGYPACIPSAANGATPAGLGDQFCPDTNRPAIAPINTIVPTPPAPPVAADSRRFAPVKVGDSIKADGSFETVGGVTFLSAWSVRIFVDLTTRTTDANGNNDPTQPDYLIINEAGWDGPAYHQGRVRGRILTNATLHNLGGNTEIDYFSVHYDPVTNQPHEQILYTTQFNKQQGAVVFNAPTGVFDSQIRMDFFPGAKPLGNAPCVALTQGPAFDPKKFLGTPSVPGVNLASYCTSTPGSAQDNIDNFNLMVPVFREVMARSTRQQVVTGQALDIHGQPAQSGQYKLPTTVDYGAFEDANLGLSAFPTTFSGTPWLMDRRLSPNGCINGCENSAQPLTPFPFEGIDPRTLSPLYGVFVVGGGGGGGGATGNTLLPTPDRMFRFMQQVSPGVFGMTGQLSWPPTNAPAYQISPVAPISIFPPVAVDDAATTVPNVPVIINVLANDLAIFGTIDPATVRIASNPGVGSVQVNPDGTITYIPPPTFSVETVTFTYTFANNYGTVSAPGTVTMTIHSPATSVSLTELPTSPQLPGTSITFTAAGTGSNGTYEYNFWLYDGANWNEVRPYSTTPTWVWNTTGLPIGKYVVAANVRTVGSPAAVNAVTYLAYQLTTPAVNLFLMTDTPSPQLPGTQVTFAAAAAGGSGTYEYRFWLFDGATWTLKQDYSPTPAWTWDTSQLSPGNYTIGANARNVGSTADSEASTFTPYKLTTTASGVNLFFDQPSPHAAGTPVTFAASGVGGSGLYEYRFWLFDVAASNWSLAQDYSGTPTWSLAGTAPAGDYVIAVDVRNAGSAVYRDSTNQIGYTIQ